MAFFRGGPIDHQVREFPSYPFFWRAPIPFDTLLFEGPREPDWPTTKVGLYERTDIVYRGARVYKYVREETF